MKKIYTWILIVLILTGTIFQGIVMFKSGHMRSFGIGYWGPLARDGIWHEALVGQLTKSVPPINPGMAGEVLSNYHYFYDLSVSVVGRIGIPANVLLYIFFPALFSVLLGIGTFKLANILFKDTKTGLFAVFFAYFASSFGWIVNLIRHEQIGGESTFWANQPVSMNINPPYAVSLVILIFSIVLLNAYLKKPNILKGALLSILFGVLVGFKAYAGAIALFALFVLTLKKVVFDKNLSLLPVLIVSAGIFLVIFFTIGRSASGLIKFQPFWLIDTMIDAGDRVGIPNFTARRFAYAASNKLLKLYLIEALSFVIFFVGNLGTRMIGIFKLNRKELKGDLFIFILGAMLASFLPPLIFVQKGNAWNIVQFFYYFLFFAGLFAADAIRKLSPTVAILLIIATPTSSIATFRGWLYPNPPAYLSQGEYSALKYLSNQDEGIVLKHPFDPSLRGTYKDPYPLSVYADNAYVSAYSKKSVYIEDVEQQLILATDYSGRFADAKRFFVEKDLSWSNKFLKQANIKYVYIPKIYHLPMAEEEYLMKKIFENEDVNIYKVI